MNDSALRTDELMEMVRAVGEHPDEAGLGSPGWEQQPGIRYPLSALASPLNLTLVLSAVAVGVFSGQLWVVPAAVALDLVTVAAVSRGARFRRAMDLQWARARREMLSRRLEGVVAGLLPEERSELESLVTQYKEMVQRGGATTELIEERLEPAKLLADYRAAPRCGTGPRSAST